MSCAAFLERLDELERTVSRTLKTSATTKRFTLGDAFPSPD
jgi:hypothetical protein